MTTYSAYSTASDKMAAHALGLALERLVPEPTGIGVIEIEDGSGRFEVAAYFTDHPDEVALDLLAAVHGARPFAVSRLDDTDWMAKVRRELTPVIAGRFVVHGGHDADQVPSHLIALRIEAAMAFGTGHHGTTAGCLWEIDRLAREGFAPDRIADIGTGTGVLAMAAARIWPAARVLASDIDGVAVATARANVAANGLRGRIVTLRAPGMRSGVLRETAPYALIMANILARPLKAMAPDFAAACAPGGRIRSEERREGKSV